MNFFCNLCLSVVFASGLFAQSPDSLLLDKHFRFADGLYRSHEQLLTNTPDLLWSQAELAIYTNPNTLITKVQASDSLLRASLWAIVMDGLPYVRAPQQKDEAELISFAALKIRGRLSLMSYPIEAIRKVPITAYNPANGRPFRQGEIERSERIVVEYLLHMPTGRVAPFGKGPMLAFAKADPQLKRAIAEIDEQREHDKLFKSIQIYDDRHPMYLPAAKSPAATE